MNLFTAIKFSVMHVLDRSYGLYIYSGIVDHVTLDRSQSPNQAAVRLLVKRWPVH